MYTVNRFPAPGLSGAGRNGRWVSRHLAAFAASALVTLTPASADWHDPATGEPPEDFWYEMYEPEIVTPRFSTTSTSHSTRRG